MTENSNRIDTSSLDLTKDRVMVGNNAHTIFEHLKSLNNDPRHRQRWIWELLQNAQDVNGRDIQIKFANEALSFSHNGSAFSEEDITHLIFHGSSKPRQSGKRGKFGTGFMTTHLLSKKVQIKGNLEDGRSFDFELTREGNDDSEMADALNASWDNFKNSLHVERRFQNTTFTYLDLSPEACATVENVLGSLPNLMPYVMAFSGQIDAVKIFHNQTESKYQRSTQQSDTNLKIIDFDSSEPSLIPAYRMFVHKFENGKGEIAIPLAADNEIAALAPNIPRLFITFPLIGTDQAFPFPFLINSEHFEPSPEREKLWLSAESNAPETATNKGLLETAFAEYINLCNSILKLDFRNVHVLANVGAHKGADWLDTTWFKDQMATMFNELDQMLLLEVSTPEASAIALSDARIPSSEGESNEEADSTWGLCNYLFPERIPKKANAPYWRIVLKHRLSYSDTSIHPSAFGLKDVCLFVHQAKDNRIENVHPVGINSFEFIQKLVDELEVFNYEKYWSEYNILPDQNGALKKSACLHQELLDTDQEIGDRLKTIAEGLNAGIKGILLDNQIDIKSENHRLAKYEKDALIATLVSNIKRSDYEKATPRFQTSTISLLAWLVENGKWNELPGYPIKMHSDKWDKLQVSKEPFLCPASLWPPDFQKYIELFPPDYILHEENKVLFNDLSLLQKAGDQNLVLPSPLYQDRDEINSNEIRLLITRRADKEKLSKNENAEWKAPMIEFSKVAYFSTPKDKNVIDRSRSSRSRTTKLLQFIVEVLIHVDLYGFSRREINVEEGGGYKTIVGIYPSFWLRDIKNRDWVRDHTPNANRPSVESLLPYFSYTEGGDNSLYHSLENPQVSRLLHFLEIGVGDLLRNIRSGNNEEERISWDQSYVSILMNKSLTPEKVRGMLADSEFISQYEAKLTLDKIRKANQEIGTAVEKAFEAAFSAVPGYGIKREPIGSDYVVECDSDHYLLVNREDKNKFFIEIKSSRSREVRMTQTQGSVAIKPEINYVLCVVPVQNGNINAETVISNARFVINIAALIKNKVESVHQITNLQSQVTGTSSDGIWTSIEGTNIRYVIGDQNWQLGKSTVLDFKAFVSGVIDHSIPELPTEPGQISS